MEITQAVRGRLQEQAIHYEKTDIEDEFSETIWNFGGFEYCLYEEESSHWTRLTVESNIGQRELGETEVTRVMEVLR